MANLNAAQAEAVATLTGPLLVLAGAGTGKTRVVTYRIARLIKSGVPPQRILAVTFTNKAAAEMQERVRSLLGRVKERPVISTFHSHCVKILRRHIRRLGYPEKFAIYDRGDQESLARSVLREIRVPGELLRPGDLVNLISRWKSACIRPKEAGAAAETDREHLAAMGYRRYQRALKTAGAVDFDDLLLLTEDLFAEHDEARREEAQRFDHILIDEYQDTNGSQYRIVKALAEEHRNLCVVGDDDQSIYGWRGAQVEHILRFHHDWPGAKVVKLEENYRSTAAILSAANRLIAFNKLRHDKVLVPARPGGEKPRIEQFTNETKEAQSVVADILRKAERESRPLNEFAVLFRTNEQPRAFETELRKSKVPYVLIGGKSFFDRAEVKDILAYLRVLASPQDEVSLRRIAKTPPRGISAGALEALVARAVEQGNSLWDVMRAGRAGGGEISPKGAEAVGQLVALVEEYRGRLAGQSLAQIAGDLIAKIDFVGYLRGRYPDEGECESRIRAVEEVVNAVAAYEQRAQPPTLDEFLDEIALGDREESGEKEKQLEKNAVILMTLHSAKGLEFPSVYMVGMEEGILPHHRSAAGEGTALDEERRLCYVGVTRAQERLTLTLSLTRLKWGRPRDTQPSRFLFELTGLAEK